MQIQQIYTGCLAQGAYYIESNGEVAIIDPLREVDSYIRNAESDGATIKYILETHFHADFVSGHLDLADKTGATIVYGPTAKPHFHVYIAQDGEIMKLGNVSIKVIHTPGHTMESSCYLLFDEAGKATALFTGDTLFIGDVGRPDLAQKVVADLTQEKLAGHLYDSLHEKLLPLADNIIVYPAHGAGSACGKNMSRETFDTLGHQKDTNYALQPMSREEFITKLLDGLMPPPGYFSANVLMNIKGYDSIDKVLSRGQRALDVNAFEAAMDSSDILILDTRDAQTFSKGFIPQSINIGLDGSFAPWVGALIVDINQKILIVAEPGKEEEVVTRLARVGFDHSVGFLAGGFEAWKQSGKKTDTITSISVEEFITQIENNSDACILDVRKQNEYASEHVIEAANIPLDYINEHITEVPKNKTCYVHCAGGYRSMIFVSILRAKGFTNLIHVKGGLNDLKASGKFNISVYVPPISLL